MTQHANLHQNHRPENFDSIDARLVITVSARVLPTLLFKSFAHIIGQAQHEAFFVLDDNAPLDYRVNDTVKAGQSGMVTPRGETCVMPVEREFKQSRLHA